MAWNPYQSISEHVEGKYTEVLTRPKLDERTGEHIDFVFEGTRNRIISPLALKM